MTKLLTAGLFHEWDQLGQNARERRGGPLVDAVTHAKSLPRLAERMQMQHRPERVLALDAGPLEVLSEKIVVRQAPLERPICGRAIGGAKVSELIRKFNLQRHGALILVFRRALPKNGGLAEAMLVQGPSVF